MSDITFELGDTTINLRAGAIILRDEEVLLCRSPEDLAAPTVSALISLAMYTLNRHSINGENLYPSTKIHS